MQVYKFGGASVKDAEALKNLLSVIKNADEKQLLIVVSAMGKTTNELEKLAESYFKSNNDVYHIFENIKLFHYDIINELFDDKSHPVFNEVNNTFTEIDWIIEDEPHDSYDFIYDQIISIGEMVSSRILSNYLNFCGIQNKWEDARTYIQTDNTYREGIVDWQKTELLVNKYLPPILEKQIVVTQGFIGNTSENFTTTLGREGSDYSAAIFAFCLKAESVTVWKDVEGILNADPKIFSDTVKFDTLSYTEAMEMTYYGATVIHPKTIKPLQNKGIPLFVKPFLNPQAKGTQITQTAESVKIPVLILKKGQLLITLNTKDFSFITENHLKDIFTAFANHLIKINVMQISALSFSACFDFDENKFTAFNNLMMDDFTIKFNKELNLLTIRHFTPEVLKNHTEDKTIFLEQLSRNTAQLVFKSA